MRMKKQIAKEKKTGKLSAVLVDEFSEYIAQALKDTKLSQKDVLRFRISVETSMLAWLEQLGEGAECTFELSRRFGRIAITVTCEGEKCNPQQASNEEFGILENSSLLQSLGLSVGYSYENGINRIRLMPSSGFVQQLAPIMIALALGIGLALALKAINPAAATNINTQIVDPVFSTMMSVLRAIASPLIFLAVLSGIYGIGDIASLGTIGKKLLGRFFFMTFVTLGVTFAILLTMVGTDFGSNAAGKGEIEAILDLVLQFVPSDIVSPFLNGNMLQIITISVACGLVMLILGDRVSELSKIVDQIYSVVQLLMEAIGRLVPGFIFISIVSLVLSNDGIDIRNIIQPVIAIAGTFLVMAVIIYPIILKIKYNIGFSMLMKKLLPTFLVAFTTASSAAAFSVNVETCETKLGISDKITRFGVPLGQVVFMPIAAAEYLTISMVMAKSWNVEISITWIVTAIIVCGILSIATPPIPGGAMSIFTVLFLQLNIPNMALPIALGIDLLIDYVITAGDIMCLQEEMIICADQTGLLDREKLVSE